MAALTLARSFDYPRFAGPEESPQDIYHRILGALDPRARSILRLGARALAYIAREAAEADSDPLVLGLEVETWIRAYVGRIDDQTRRAAVAILALGLDPDRARLPAQVLGLYPDMHRRLARFLTGPRRYDPDIFAKDVALATGVHAPAGLLTVALPQPGATPLAGVRARRAAGGFCRQMLQRGPHNAFSWLAAWGAAPWAELHIDARNLRDFNIEGLIRAYLRLAALMETRPDLAGLYGASWLFDPEANRLCPELSFARGVSGAGGARFLRLRVDPAQSAYAVAHSPRRRRLVALGRYRPVCWAMYWSRRDILAWAERIQGQPGSHSHSRRTG